MVIMGMRQQNEVRFQRVNINVRSLRITRYKRINKEMNTIYGNPQARMPVTCNFHTFAFWCKDTPKIPHMRERYKEPMNRKLLFQGKACIAYLRTSGEQLHLERSFSKVLHVQQDRNSTRLTSSH